MRLHRTGNSDWLFVNRSVHLLVWGSSVLLIHPSSNPLFIRICGHSFKCSGDLTRYQHFVAHTILIMWTWTLPYFTVFMEELFIGGEIPPGIHISVKQHNPDHLAILSRSLYPRILWSSLERQLKVKGVCVCVCVCVRARVCACICVCICLSLRLLTTMYSCEMKFVKANYLAILCFLQPPAFIIAISIIYHYCDFNYHFTKFDFKYFNQHPHLILLPTFSSSLIHNFSHNVANFDFQNIKLCWNM